MKRKKNLMLVSSAVGSRADLSEFSEYRRKKAFENPVPAGDVCECIFFAGYVLAVVEGAVVLESDCLKEGDVYFKKGFSSLNREMQYYLKSGFMLVFSKVMRGKGLVDAEACYCLKFSKNLKDVEGVFMAFEQVVSECKKFGYDNAKVIMGEGKCPNVPDDNKSFAVVEQLLTSLDGVREIRAKRVERKVELLSFLDLVEACVADGVMRYRANPETNS